MDAPGPGSPGDLEPWRLRPHFVFNALNSIAQLACASDRERTITLVTALGDMLQRSLECAGRFVTLCDEVSTVPRYLEVEAIRHCRPFPLEVEVEPAARVAFVPPFVLQPVIEDLVRHVVSNRVAEPVLGIRGRVRGMRLEVEVRARGVAERPGREASDHPGIRDLRAQLADCFGSECRLAMVTERAGAGIARLHIPFAAAPESARIASESASGFDC